MLCKYSEPRQLTEARRRTVHELILAYRSWLFRVVIIENEYQAGSVRYFWREDGKRTDWVILIKSNCAQTICLLDRLSSIKINRKCGTNHIANDKFLHNETTTTNELYKRSFPRYSQPSRRHTSAAIEEWGHQEKASDAGNDESAYAGDDLQRNAQGQDPQ